MSEGKDNTSLYLQFEDQKISRQDKYFRPSQKNQQQGQQLMNDDINNHQNTKKQFEDMKNSKNIRKSYEDFQKHYLKLEIIKAFCFGILIGLIIFTVIYLKLIIKNPSFHQQFQFQQYQSTEQQLTVIGPPQQISSISTEQPVQQQPQIKLETLKVDQPVKNKIAPVQRPKPIERRNDKKIERKIEKRVDKKSDKKNEKNEVVERKSDKQVHRNDEKKITDRYTLQGKLWDSIQKFDLKKISTAKPVEFTIQLLEINHNVNFKGQIVINPQAYGNQQIDIQEKKQRISTLLKIEKDYYDKNYQILKYMKYQLPFCLVVPSYNNVKSRLYLRNLDSIFMQEYENYHVVYVDDASPDMTGQFVKKYVLQNNIPDDKIKVIINPNNLMALANIYDSIHNQCKSGQIVALLDGDDSFIGRQVLSTTNAVYQQTRAGMVYSQYLVISSNSWAGIGGSSRLIPAKALKNDTFRKLRGFYTSHLITFYADIFWKVKKSDLTYQNGTFFDFAYDVALITPIIQMINPRIVFLRQGNYEYRFDTGINDPGWGQIKVDKIVFDKPPYQRLKQYPFIDAFYNKIQKQDPNFFKNKQSEKPPQNLPPKL